MKTHKLRLIILAAGAVTGPAMAENAMIYVRDGLTMGQGRSGACFYSIPESVLLQTPSWPERYALAQPLHDEAVLPSSLRREALLQNNPYLLPLLGAGALVGLGYLAMKSGNITQDVAVKRMTKITNKSAKNFSKWKQASQVLNDAVVQANIKRPGVFDSKGNAAISIYLDHAQHQDMGALLALMEKAKMPKAEAQKMAENFKRLQKIREDLSWNLHLIEGKTAPGLKDAEGAYQEIVDTMNGALQGFDSQVATKKHTQGNLQKFAFVAISGVLGAAALPQFLGAYGTQTHISNTLAGSAAVEDPTTVEDFQNLVLKASTWERYSGITSLPCPTGAQLADDRSFITPKGGS